MRKVFAALMSLALSLVLAELTLRSAGQSEKYFVWKPGQRTVSNVAPGVMRGIEGQATFTINEVGVRGDPVSDDQRVRILALGGSTTECFYLDAREAWPHLLQENLSEEWGVPVWVGSAGKSGHKARNHVLQTQKLLAQPPRVDVVLVLVGINDFHQYLALDTRWRSTPAFEYLSQREQLRDLCSAFSVLPPSLQVRGSFYKRTEIWSLLQRARVSMATIFEPPPNILDAAGTFYVNRRQNRQLASGLRTKLPDLRRVLREYRRDLTMIIKSARARGVRPVLLTQPVMWREDLPEDLQQLMMFGGVGNYFEEPGKEYYSVEALAKGMEKFNANLMDACEQQGADYIDLASALPKDDTVFFDDCHFNESGARQVAAVLARELARILGPPGDPPID